MSGNFYDDRNVQLDYQDQEKERYVGRQYLEKGNSQLLRQDEVRQMGFQELRTEFSKAGKLVDDLVLKKYVRELTKLNIVPLPTELKNIENIRLFKITEMVYQKGELSTYKFASVFSAVQNLNCGVFILLNSDGKKTDFYMGVRSYDGKRTTKSLKDTLKNALTGQFPGVLTEDLLNFEVEKTLEEIPTKNIAAVSCIAQNKDEGTKNNEIFIQGMEKIAVAMYGKRYSLLVLARGTSAKELEDVRKQYETIYTQLSPFAALQLSYGSNEALNISEALSQGSSVGTSHQKSSSLQSGSSHQTGYTESHGETIPSNSDRMLKTGGNIALGVASLIAAPLTGGLSIAAAAAIDVAQIGLNNMPVRTVSNSKSNSRSDTFSTSRTEGESYGENSTETKGRTDSRGISTGSSRNTQLTMQNRSIQDVLQKIDMQLKRLDECESTGLWECAAYAISDEQETAEMLAGTYKALMMGKHSGIESASINLWTYRENTGKISVLRDYLTNFIHPVFEYQSEGKEVPVTAASLVSSNELAIQMGLPRKSVCGFPVVEHADFGKEIVLYQKDDLSRGIDLGKIFNMGREMEGKVSLDRDSLTMHTFITGSTGSGKSNTVYKILQQLNLYSIPFLVVEPAKGEYKQVFGNRKDVQVYGTNPYLSPLLRINPFRFPKGIHVLEHADRLVEIFNVCFPMYAAMPAVLKDAVLRAYESSGWDLVSSRNGIDETLFPCFEDLLLQLQKVIESSAYDQEAKSNYRGALETRIRSLANGLNGQIFSCDEIPEEELFDKNVIIDLSRVSSTETKALIMGILVMRLNEYRISHALSMNAPLRHVTVLEEAHNILKRTSTEQSSESSNITGKAVETISNSIAEMRTYGEGFLIVDQSPNMVDISAIRNTNTKILMRLPEEKDRNDAGKSAALSDEQLRELAKLPKGVAVVYQNNWIEPVLCKIDRFPGEENTYRYDASKADRDQKKRGWFRTELMRLLLKGRMKSEFEPDLERLRGEIAGTEYPVLTKRYLYRLLEEYRRKHSLSIWERKEDLNHFVPVLLRGESESYELIENSHDMEEVRENLDFFLQREAVEDIEGLRMAVSDSIMADFSERSSEDAQIYERWREFVLEGGKLL